MLADQLVALRSQGRDVVLVSSGAIVAGLARLNLTERPREVHLSQAAAAVGQSALVRAYEEFYAGYGQEPATLLQPTFEQVGGYRDVVLLRDSRLESHCEHHMVPILGTVHVAYLPGDRVVGISKLVRVVEAFARRLQTQETLCAQIGDTLHAGLQARGVAVLIDAAHQCMTTRGVRQPGVSTVTTHFTGVYQNDAAMQDRIWRLLERR